MTQSEFEMIVEQRKIAIGVTLQAKSKEYATDADRMHNFNTNAAFIGCTPEENCLHLMMKHMTSIRDIVKSMPSKLPSTSTVDEKIGDAINYLILLECLVKKAIARDAQYNEHYGPD